MGDNWTPVSRAATEWLPNNRAYTKIEALFSLQLNHANDQSVTVLGLANLWGWSYRQVSNFLDELNITIVYPEDTKKRQKQSGKIMKRKPEENEKKKFIFSEDLQNGLERKRKETEKKTKTYIKPLESLKTIKPKNNKTRLPEDFGISDRVIRWAKEKGHSDLEIHLEYFKSKAKAHGYMYVDWDEAFMGAISGDWAKTKTRPQYGPKQDPPRKMSKMEEGVRALEDWANGRINVDSEGGIPGIAET